MPVQELLDAVRRRLRWAWAIATAQWLAPAVALAALALVLAGRMRPWAWPERAALVIVGLVVLGVALLALVVRIPPLLAARAADRGLRTGDAFAAALELADTPGVLPERVRGRAAALASGTRARDAVPLPTRRRRLLVVAALAAGAFGLAWLPNPQDDVRRQRAAEQATLDAEAEQLREASDALAETPGAAGAERAAAEKLRELADDLEDAGSLDEGLQELAQAQADLQASVPPDLLARKPAVTGLQRSLESQPLPGTAAALAAEQLEQLAEALAGLSPEDRAALTERLSQLAEAQAVGNPEAADALEDAAAALSAGDLAGARAALGEAAAAQAAGADDVATAEATSAAARAAAEAAGRLSSRPGSDGDGGGDGRGQDEGEGQGQGSGTGQGQASGQGQGSGQGGQGQGGQGGQGGGNPSGNVAGSSGGTGSGRGGQGRPSDNANGAGNGPAPADEQGADASVYVPGYSEGDKLEAGGSGPGEPGETVGQGNGPTGRGGSRVPLSELPQSYRDAMVAALERSDLPPTLRDVIQAYFESTAGL